MPSQSQTMGQMHPWVPVRHAAVGFMVVLATFGLAGCEDSAGEPEPMSEQEQEALEAKQADTPTPSRQQPGTSAQQQAPQGPADPRAQQAPGDPRAQQAPSPPPTPSAGAKPQEGQAAQDEQLPEAKVEAFADAYMKAQDVRKDLREELATAKSEDKARAIQQQATQKMEKAVEATGMDFETYASLTRRLESDSDFRGRVRDTLREKQTN